jgi:hypothetical protein
MILLWAGAARVKFNGPRLAPMSLDSMNLLGRKSTNFSAVHGRDRVFEPQDEEGFSTFRYAPGAKKETGASEGHKNHLKEVNCPSYVYTFGTQVHSMQVMRARAVLAGTNR